MLLAQAVGENHSKVVFEWAIIFNDPCRRSGLQPRTYFQGSVAAVRVSARNSSDAAPEIEWAGRQARHACRRLGVQSQDCE